MATHHEMLHDLAAAGRTLRDAIPEVYAGYVRMSAAALGEGGVVSAKTRELIALAIAVTRECDGCIAAHARGAASRGATAAGGRRDPRRGHLHERRSGHGLGAAGLRRIPGIRGRASLNQRTDAGAGSDATRNPVMTTQPLR